MRLCELRGDKLKKDMSYFDNDWENPHHWVDSFADLSKVRFAYTDHTDEDLIHLLEEYLHHKWGPRQAE